MIRNGLILTTLLSFSACKSSSDSSNNEKTTVPLPSTSTKGNAAMGPKSVKEAANASDEIAAMFANHFEQRVALNPEFAQATGDYRFNHLFGNNLSPEYSAASKALNDEFLRRAISVNTKTLSGKERVRLAFFLYERQMETEAENVPLRLLPVNQFDSKANGFALSGSGEGLHPFQTEDDYRSFLKKAVGFSQWADSAIEQMKQGIEKGIVLPKVLIERTIPQLAAQYNSADLKQSLFYTPLKNLPASINESSRKQLITDYEDGIQNVIFPAYKKLHDFMVNEYLAHGRAEHGIDANPGGVKWYQYLIRFHTTTNMSAEEIHTIGLAEVKRIREEMDQVRVQVGFKGDLNAFFKHLSTDDTFFWNSSEELIAGYVGLKTTIDAVLPKFFDTSPKTPYEVRAVEAFREQSAAGASYQPGTPDGSRPGIFYINTFNLRAQPRWGMETLSLHEAAPGHHFQISLQQEMIDAPKFQRFSEINAFAEGWALYVESIGKEMGLFSDPYQYFGRLSDELLRAMRLVVDTGLHSKGWTREKAIRYMLDNSAMTETDLTAEVERYMAIPAQALSYKIGQFKISELRTIAEKALGDRFDIRQFHNQVLSGGSLPMQILETNVLRWIEGQPKTKPHN